VISTEAQSMRMNAPFLSYVLAAAMAAAAPLPSEAIKDALKEKSGAFILIDCASVEITDSDPAVSGKRLPPCSTFKIWNALLGIEEGILTDAADGTAERVGAIHCSQVRAMRARAIPAPIASPASKFLLAVGFRI
jgi:hypothetical protein